MTSICQLIELKEGTNHYLQSCVFPCINSASHNVTFYHTITLIYRQYNTLVLLTHCSETLQSSNVGFHQYSSDQWFRLARLELQCCPFKQCGISNFLVPTMFTAVCEKKCLVRLGKKPISPRQIALTSGHCFLFSLYRIKQLARYELRNTANCGTKWD